MRTFTIYHVPGYKVGCTADPNRLKYNFKHYGVEPHILEELELPDTTESWQIVGDLEFEHADIFGYDRGKHYRTMRQQVRLTRADCAAGGKWHKGKSKQKIKCPHCDKVSTPGGLATHIKYKHKKAH